MSSDCRRCAAVSSRPRTTSRGLRGRDRDRVLARRRGGERLRAGPGRPLPVDVPADPPPGRARPSASTRSTRTPRRSGRHRPDPPGRPAHRRGDGGGSSRSCSPPSPARRGSWPRQNRELRRSQERFRSLVQNSADVSMIVDADGTITYESAAVERVLGYRAEERIGRHALDAGPPGRPRLGAAAAGRCRRIARRARSPASSGCAMPTARGSWIEAVARTCSTTRPSAASSSTTATSPRARPSRTSCVTRRSTTR